MLNIGILSDGRFGERTYNTLSKKFPTDFIIVEYSGDLDDITISDKTLKKLKDYNLFITYLNPDITYKIVETLKDINPDAFIIVGMWKGIGFKKQIEKFGNCYCPELLCEIDEKELNIFLNKYIQLKEFLKYFGRPKVKLILKDNKIVDYKIIRESPCGSTENTLKEFLNKDFDKIKMGLRLQHFCRAGKLDLFKERECKKVKAGKIFIEGLEI